MGEKKAEAGEWISARNRKDKLKKNSLKSYMKVSSFCLSSSYGASSNKNKPPPTKQLPITRFLGKKDKKTEYSSAPNNPSVRALCDEDHLDFFESQDFLEVEDEMEPKSPVFDRFVRVDELVSETSCSDSDEDKFPNDYELPKAMDDVLPSTPKVIPETPARCALDIADSNASASEASVDTLVLVSPTKEPPIPFFPRSMLTQFTLNTTFSDDLTDEDTQGE